LWAPKKSRTKTFIVPGSTLDPRPKQSHTKCKITLTNHHFNFCFLVGFALQEETIKQCRVHLVPHFWGMFPLCCYYTNRMTKFCQVRTPSKLIMCAHLVESTVYSLLSSVKGWKCGWMLETVRGDHCRMHWPLQQHYKMPQNRPQNQQVGPSQSYNTKEFENQKKGWINTVWTSVVLVYKVDFSMYNDMYKGMLKPICWVCFKIYIYVVSRT